MVIVALSMVALVSVDVYKKQQSGEEINPLARVDYSKSSCSKSLDLEVCLSASTQDVKPSDTIKLKTVIKNLKQSTFEYTFSCTYTEPVIIINEGKLNEIVICGQALTAVSIAAGKTTVYTQNISGSDLKEGKNIVATEWAGTKSGPLSINRKPSSKSEAHSIFKTCQAIESLDNIRGECSLISITLKEEYSNYSCTQWKEMMMSLNLTVPCGELMEELGIAYTFVPKLENDSWKSKIEKLDKVESAIID